MAQAMAQRKSLLHSRFKVFLFHLFQRNNKRDSQSEINKRNRFQSDRNFLMIHSILFSDSVALCPKINGTDGTAGRKIHTRKGVKHEPKQ